MQEKKPSSVLLMADRLVSVTEQQPKVVDPSHPVDYSKSEVPPNYVCHKCGATGCKLWREYQTFLDGQTLLCAPCAGEDQKKDVSDIDEEGMTNAGHPPKSDQIGWFVPAVPTEENNSFWGYTSVPPQGVLWWRKLPTHPRAKN